MGKGNFIWGVIVFVGFVACTVVQPVYVAKSNIYHYPVSKQITENLVAANLVYTYQTDKLEHDFKASFCANLNDCSLNIKNVRNHPEFGGFDLDKHPIANNPERIKDIAIYQILYATTGVQGEKRIVSGAVFLPNMNPDKIKGAVLFFHPTYFNRNSVPSYAPDKSVNKTMAAIFASNGYIVLAPDYIGMGYDKTTLHPYVIYPQVNANDGLFMSLAVQQFFQQQNLFINKMLPLYVSGYSEGGAYALWFSRLYQEQAEFKRQLDNTQFKLTKVVPLSGAYDLSGVVYSYLFSDIGIWTKSGFNVSSSILASKIKPSLLAYALNSYAYYNESQNYTKVFNPEFFDMNCRTESIGKCMAESQPTVLTTFDHAGSHIEDDQIVGQINNAASHSFFNSIWFMNQKNGVMPLVNQDLLTSAEFMRFLHRGDIYYWRSTLPTTLVYLNDDSVVSSLNSIYAYQGMSAAGSTGLNSIGIDNSIIQNNLSDYLPNFNVDHLSGFYYLFIVALNQFKPIEGPRYK